MNGSAAPEVIVIGAGPAGLTAALYLGRFRRNVLVIHDGSSWALRTPKTHNAPVFPDGIEGPNLIDRTTRHASEFGGRIEEAEVTGIEWKGDAFRLISDGGKVWETRAVILASGIVLNQVDLPHDVHEEAIKADVLRYCPICDGYEHSDRKIGVIGCDGDGAAETLFLRRFSIDITLMPLSHPELSKEQAREMANAGITVNIGAPVGLEPRSKTLTRRSRSMSSIRRSVASRVRSWPRSWESASMQKAAFPPNRPRKPVCGILCGGRRGRRPGSDQRRHGPRRDSCNQCA